MKYFLDTEFIESGRTKPIQLLSIGIVAEDGREFYAESAEYDIADCSAWLLENVIPNMLGSCALPLSEIAAKIREFIGDEKPEFWGYYADYDWVVFCQLFGAMIDLPNGWPMYCRDLKQWCDELGNPKLPEQGKGEHNALADARWNRQVWEFLFCLASQPAPEPVKLPEGITLHSPVPCESPSQAGTPGRREQSKGATTVANSAPDPPIKLPCSVKAYDAFAFVVVDASGDEIAPADTREQADWICAALNAAGRWEVSDHIEVDGKKYFEEGYLRASNAAVIRRDETIATLEAEKARLLRALADAEATRDSLAVENGKLQRATEHPGLYSVIHDMRQKPLRDQINTLRDREAALVEALGGILYKSQTGEWYLDANTPSNIDAAGTTYANAKQSAADWRKRVEEQAIAPHRNFLAELYAAVVDPLSEEEVSTPVMRSAVLRAARDLKQATKPLREAHPAGWLFKIIVNKHLTGPPLEGQIQIAGVWGTPSSHLHFSPDEPTDPWIYWKAPVYCTALATSDRAAEREGRDG